MSRYLDTLPHPWSRNDIETAIFKKSPDAIAAIEETQGGCLWRALQDLEDTLWIFNTSTTDLLDEICLFGDRSKNPSFWYQANANEAKEHTRAVKKKLFHCTSALMALVDHARNFQRKTPIAGYADRLKNFCFARVTRFPPVPEELQHALACCAGKLDDPNRCEVENASGEIHSYERRVTEMGWLVLRRTPIY